MQGQSISYATEKAKSILLRAGWRDYGGQPADNQSIQHHSSSTDFSIITSADDVFIFCLTEPIFFHREVIRNVGEKRLHIFDASVDVTLNAFHLFLTH